MRAAATCLFRPAGRPGAELRRQRPHGGVLAWLRDVDEASLHLSVVTLGEIQRDMELTRDQDTVRAAEIERWADDVAATASARA